MVLCQKRIKEQHEKDKLIYANMFQKFAERDSKVSSVCVISIKSCFQLNVTCVSVGAGFPQKEALKGENDSQENGGEKMEIEKSEENCTSEEKA